MEFTEKKRSIFFGLPLCFTNYRISEEQITIKSGLFSTCEDDAYMYKVQDIRLKRSFMERMFGLGTLICFTSDTTNPELRLEHIKNASEIKEFILKASEDQRVRKRTLHTMDIATADLSDVDDI